MDEDTDEDPVYDFSAAADEELFQSENADAELDFDPTLTGTHTNHEQEQDHQDHHHQQQLNPTSKYLSFNRAAHNLMIHSILTSTSPTFEQISSADPDIPHRVLKTSLGKQTQTSAVRSRWKDIQERLTAEIDVQGHHHLSHKDNPMLRIPYREQWPEIVRHAHVENGRHLGWKQTMKTIQKTWCTNVRRYGIFDTYVQNAVYACPGCDFTKLPVRRKKEELKFADRTSVAARDVPRTLEEIAVKYKVLLRIDRTDRISRTSEVKDYVCHRGRSKRGRKSSGEKAARDRKSCRIGCPFRIRVVTPIHFTDGSGSSVVRDEELVQILLSPFHDGHRPGTKEDLLSLPPHPSAIRFCEYDLSDSLGNVQALVKASACRAPLLYAQAAEGDQASYRFFLLPKDVEQLAYRLKSRESVSEDDWTALHLEAQTLLSQDKVIYYQPYAPNHLDEDKQPFILVLQDPWMRENAKRFSVGSSWVVCRVLRGNQFGLPLYACTVPNQAGEELLLWLMLCSSDTGNLHECVALKTTLVQVFNWLGHVRPSAIVIEKSVSEYRAVQTAVSKDPFCWREHVAGGEQIACHVLLCWSHVRREWMENLLPELPPGQRREVYHALNSMMLATTENTFDVLLHAFNEKFKELPTVCEYVNLNWAGLGCLWRRMWPRFGRMFEHGEIDTTQFAERLWSFIKYTLLRGRSKCNIVGFLAALVGAEGETLVNHNKRKQALIDSGRVSPIRPPKKLIGGEYMLELYELDLAMVEVVDEVSLQFRMRSEILPDVFHHVCMQNSSCDCLDLAAPACKHVLGMRLIIEKYFPHLCALAPHLDEPLHSPEVFSLQHPNGESLELHFTADDSMDLCANDGGNLRALSSQCSEVKAELRRLLAIASAFNPTETALVLHTVRALKQKLHAFDTLERPPKGDHQLLGRYS